MINLFGWLMCGVIVGVAGKRISHISGLETLGLYVFAGILGALGGGIVPLIYDTRPLNVLSFNSLVLSVIGAIGLVALTQALMRHAS